MSEDDVGIRGRYVPSQHSELGCECKAKKGSILRQHRAAVHDNDVLWWYCD